ncbi:WD40 repeat-like protein [Artomyces pyxidatus]|uniref:WD40 repeat-like protein n=1 Tax=Artomyces pyxidatus TaxID=48021 RepID=A0ACB8SW42_9AGAM|nr:WD40 repeat-like protein [Artomyces pyxidatus]
MNSTPLVVPFTLLNPRQHTEDVATLFDVLHVVEDGCSAARASSITSWTRDGLDSSVSHMDSLGGVAMGCQDGSVYIFSPSSHFSHTASDFLDVTPPSRPSSPSLTPRPGRSQSRSSTPSSLGHGFTPFTVSHRARAVSGVSNEQVQAPKNYVDFDDEPEKLKGLLKSGVRETTVADKLLPSFEKNLAVIGPSSSASSSTLDTPSLGVTRRSEAKSLLSATHSPVLTVKALSAPASPALPRSPVESPYPFNLALHVFPPRFGAKRGVTDLQTLQSGSHLVCLQSHGDLSLLSVNDGSCCFSSQIPTASPTGRPLGGKGVEIPENAWIWNHLAVIDAPESTFIVACATLDEEILIPSSLNGMEDERRASSRIALYDVRTGSDLDKDEIVAEKIADWLVDGQSSGIGICKGAQDSVHFYHLDPSHHLITQRLIVKPRAVVSEETDSEEKSSTHLSIPSFNPFKAGHLRSKDHLLAPEDEDPGDKVELDVANDRGELPCRTGLRGLCIVATSTGQLRGLAWSDKELAGFQCDGDVISHTFTSAAERVKNVRWVTSDTYSVLYSDRVEIHSVSLVDANNDPVKDQAAHGILSTHITGTMPLHNAQAVHVLSHSHVLSTNVGHTSRRKIELRKVPPEEEKHHSAITLWKAHKDPKPAVKPVVTCMLPLELTQIILGYDNGRIGRSSFPILMYNSETPSKDLSDVPLDGFIVSLHLVQNDRSGERLIVGGADDGSVAIWSLESLKMLDRWTPFLFPLSDVVQLRQDKGGPLRGCVMAVSSDGTIAVLAIDEYQFLYTIPGAQAPLSRICVGGDNLLLVYAHDRARLWDAKTREFWRSMSLDKANEMLEQGGWTEIPLDAAAPSMPAGIAPVTSSAASVDAASTLMVDLQPFLARAVSIAKARTITTDENAEPGLPPSVGVIRAMLAAFLTPGLNVDIDMICRDRLKIASSVALVGFHRNNANTMPIPHNSQASWCVSAEVSAARALAIVSCLRTLNYFEDLSDDVSTVIAFYATSLPHVIGPSFIPPSLPFLAQWWFETSVEIRSAARTLFDAGVAGLSTEATISMVDHWQHQLPFLQSDSEKKSPSAANALLLCGYIAANQYSLLSSSALNTISKSIVMYLHDDAVMYRVLAIDLCSRGFHIWQHYVDAMEMLRSLFSLATNNRKESISAQNVGPQARQAVLQIVTHNTALFMTTLSLDILHPQDLEHRKSVMQLVAFLIRKKPLVIYPNLPRLVEAVVKSLDPNSTSNREAVLDTATEILGHVVKTFPTVDFHMASQHLAVGTGEGAIIMYDLKTATRLYVLEGHKKTPTACSFSPDGRRLVTVSLEEGVVLVWKVGSSFTSFFYPGAPPRQGHSGSDPFKTLSFTVGDEANMSVEDSLEAVRFDWAAERSVRLKIRGVTLTFST